MISFSKNLLNLQSFGESPTSLGLGTTPNHTLLGVLDVAQPLTIPQLVMPTMLPLTGHCVVGVQRQESPPIVGYETNCFEDEIRLFIRHEVGDREPRKTRPKFNDVDFVKLSIK